MILISSMRGVQAALGRSEVLHHENEVQRGDGENFVMKLCLLLSGQEIMTVMVRAPEKDRG